MLLRGAATALLALLLPARAAAEVVVLVSHDSAPYEQAVRGLREAVGTQGRVRVVALGGDVAAGRAALATAPAGAVVVALGAVAIEAAAAQPERPVVAAMALREQDVPRAANVTGVHLELPLSLQISSLKKALPRVHSLAVVYNPRESGEAVEQARKAAARDGLELEAVAAPEPQDIPRALDQVAGRADALLGLTDSVVYSPQTAKGILLFSFRNRVPLVGLPAAWIQAGALLGLDRDYVDVGRQAGEAALRILKGTAPSAIATVGPRKTCFFANQRTAEHMKVQITPEALQGACGVY